MRCLMIALGVLLAATSVDAQSVQSPLSIVITPPQIAGFIYPVITGISPNLVTVPIPAAAGAVVATASVQNSDGTAFAGTLSVSGDSLFTTSGMNVILSRATTSADQNQPHQIIVTATAPGTNGASVSWALAPNAGSIPCDIGPPVSAIPAAAQAAGFTHCAMNLDFSQPLYAKSANWTYVNYFSSPMPPNTLGSGFLFFPSSAGVKFFPEQAYLQTFDTLAGKNVMDFHWDPLQNGNIGSAWSGGVGQSNQVGVGTWNQSINNYSGSPTWDVGNYYLEDVVRIPQAYTEAVNAGGPDDVFMYSADTSHEADIPEFQTNKLTDLEGAVSGVVGVYFHNNFPCDGFTTTNWDNTPCKITIPNFSNLQYHKYSVLRTSDGVTDTRFCGFIDDLMQGMGCGPQLANPGGAVDKTFTDRSALYMSAGSNAGNAVNPIDLNVEYVRIWSCPSYKTTMCNGTTLQSATQNGQPETYYSGAQ